MDSIMSYQSRRFVVIKDKTNHVVNNHHGIFASAPNVKEKEAPSSNVANVGTNNGVGFTLPSLKLNNNSSANNSH